ncbi:MAG: T9SS type A sorting domain-containing protein [Bacteroidales bacterium]|nr:T9SS type A sorting domain-containing protein [Bacteroidales bacterium]MCF8455055.1 T9SS type A sorting domain-containing protein [Bacteroidales bacterium]
MKKLFSLISISLLLPICLFSQGLQYDWAVGFGGPGGEFGMSIAVDENGYLYIVGESNGYSVSDALPQPTNPPANYYINSIQAGVNVNPDAFIISINPNYELVWTTYFGGSKWDQGLACTTTGDNKLYIAGRATNNQILPSVPFELVDFNPISTVDYYGQINDDRFQFAARFGIDYTQYNPIGINTIPQRIFYSFPNPTSDYLYVFFDYKFEAFEYKIFDVLGKCVLQRIITPKTNLSIDVRDLAQGVYTLKIIGRNNVVLSNKFIKI